MFCKKMVFDQFMLPCPESRIQKSVQVRCIKAADWSKAKPELIIDKDLLNN